MYTGKNTQLSYCNESSEITLVHVFSMCNINCLRASRAFKRALQDNANFLSLQMILIFFDAFLLLLLLGLSLVLITSEEISLRLDELLSVCAPLLILHALLH